MQVSGSHRLRRAGGWVLDHPWYVVLAVGAVAFVSWVIGTRTQPYHVRVEFTSGFNLVSGLPVDVAGQQVGMISGVQYLRDASGGAAVVTIGIADRRYAPLHAGTTVESRWGSTIGNGTRRLDLTPGAASGPVIRDGGIIEAADTTPAVDLDQVLNVLNARRRVRLTNLLSNLGAGLGGESQGIHGAINSAPPAFGAANAIMRDLASNTYALRGLITNGNLLTQELASRSTAISDLVSAAGQTFGTVAAHANGVQASIADMPPALTQARATLARLDTSVNTLTTLVSDIRPGAAALSPLAVAMRPALAELQSVVPTGVATLDAATSAAPSITRLLSVGAPFMPRLRSATSQLAPLLACIRPYAPEAGSAIEGAAEWMSTYERVKPNAVPGVTYTGAPDGQYVDQHGVRAMPEASLASDHASAGMSTPAFLAASGKQYAEPRPPGLSVGQPWFLPQCGAGPSSLNPALDPENPNK